MYTRLKNVQILISLLKQHGIRHMVLSAGQSNYNFVRSVESDEDFICYSVVDERSAAFFALGLAQKLMEPVAISCTASTAGCNYLSAVTEAYYQGVPLVVLTSNRDVRNLEQMELLMIRQDNLFRNVCKKEVQLPEVRSQKDFIYCQRMINETLLELDHHGKGPVHIDIPHYDNDWTVDRKELPQTVKVSRHRYGYGEWDSVRLDLLNKSKIMLVCGQSQYTKTEKEYINLFSQKYNCIVAAEHMANITGEFCININPVVMNAEEEQYSLLAPDVVITLGRHLQMSWPMLGRGNSRQWSVNESGALTDPYGKLTDVFECSNEQFLKFFIEQSPSSQNTGDYFGLWKQKLNEIAIPETDLCHIYAIKKILSSLPSHGILHLSILNSIRISQYFDIPEGIECFANLGALGIDGSMSTFIGQAAVSTEEAYLIIGDLSFFYDMNSLKIKHIKENVHILLLNNSGGGEFYQNNGKYDTLDLHTAARHHVNAKGWAESNSFEYISASSKEEYMEKLPGFVAKGGCPKLFEVFTDMETDMEAMRSLLNSNQSTSSKRKVKNVVKKIVGVENIQKIRDIIACCQSK